MSETPQDALVPEQPTLAVTVRDAVQALDAVQAPQQKTSQQMRVVEVSEALVPAYQKASTLELSDSEVDALMAPFPDEVIEVRPHDGLLYIPHIFVSDRLNRIFRPGKWALVRRREWFDADSNTMYGEYVLIIRGCYVGESVGGHPFAKNNPKINYSDVLESTAAEALRRIAGKRLSCGSQVWNPEYCRQWEKTWRGYVNGKWCKKEPSRTVPPTPMAQGKAAASAPPKVSVPTTAHRERMIQRFGQDPAAHDYAREFFERCGAILPNEGLEDVPLSHVPATAEQMEALLKAIDAFSAGEEARLPYPIHAVTSTKAGKTTDPADPPEPPSDEAPKATGADADDAPWRSYPMPFGKNAGVLLSELDKKYLYGLWANYAVETEYNGKPKKPETIARDQQFRDMLDEAGKHYKFT